MKKLIPLAIILVMVFVNCADDSSLASMAQPIACGSATYTANQFCQSPDVVKDLCGTGKLTYEENQICEGGIVLTRCGTGSVHHNPATEKCCVNSKYNPLTHSCYNSRLYSCENKPYDPATHFCHSDGELYSCANLPYDPSTHFCQDSTNVIYPFCDGETFSARERCRGDVIVTDQCQYVWYHSDTHFCHSDIVYSKCGGVVAYDPPTEECCASRKYVKDTHFCQNGSNNVLPFCNRLDYEPTHFCYSGSIIPKCGGYAEYDPPTEQCCGSYSYRVSMEFCYSETVYAKCGTQSYNPAREACCYDQKYNLETQLCQSGQVIDNPNPPSRPTCPTIPTNYENVEGAAELAAWLNGFGYDNITVSQEGGVVIVEYIPGKADQTDQITLDIPAGVKVEWGIGGNHSGVGPTLTLKGYGTLELTSELPLKHNYGGDVIFIESGSPTLVILGEVYVATNGTAIRTAPGSSPNIFLSNASELYGGDGAIVLLGGGNIVVTGNTEIISNRDRSRIYRGPSATVNGFYDNNTNKAYFDGGSWAEGVNLFPK